MESTKKKKIKFMQKPLWYRIFMIGAGAVIVLLLCLIGYAYRLMNLVNYDTGENASISPTDHVESVENPEDYTHLPVATLENVESNDLQGRSEKGIYNILLLGLDRDSGNLADTNIIVTIDTNNKKIKMSSMMRDSLVQIPGYNNNKLNTPYGKGGIQLVYDVYATNFDIKLDGYVAVNFSDLTKVIDKLGGISVYITASEADYLNTSNYIADPASRNLEVTSGYHWMNGSQAVGYARIRYIGNGKEADDFARTQRQRDILTAVYEKFRGQSLTQLLSLLETVLPLVTTDLDMVEMINMATEAFNAGILNADIEQLRIPLNDAYKNSTYLIYDINMSVLELDFEANTKALHAFIFGDEPEKENEKETTKGIIKETAEETAKEAAKETTR